jgi:hypothetical protein
MEVRRNPLTLVTVKGNERAVWKVVLAPEQMSAVRENLPDPHLLMAELCVADLQPPGGHRWRDSGPVGIGRTERPFSTSRV